MKRCEITVPLYYNDGRPIEEEKLETTKKELIEKSGGFSFNPHWSGRWRHEGRDYEDKNAIFQVDHKNIDIEFLSAYKEVLKERFQQLEIRITIHDISVV